MDSDIEMDDSAFSIGDESEEFEPEVAKPKAKAAVAKAVPKKAAVPAKPAAKRAPKKMTQTTLPLKPAPKKRVKPESDDDDGSDNVISTLSNTPPSAKKQKKAPVKRDPADDGPSNPLGEIDNDSAAATANKIKTDSENYQKLTQLEHIIKRPDTYIGSVEMSDQQMWVFNKETTQMVHRTVSFVPGLYKIFDEILVNAADNKQRDPSMTYMKVNIDRDEGLISVENNGKAIPVVIHEKEKVYIPELVFGHLLAGSNFDDTEKKTVGGRNGYGAKLCNVFSTEFTLEVQDKQNTKRYKQTWTHNMTKMGKPQITANKMADFVRVTFKPDFDRFGMPNGIDDDLESLLVRRVYDMAGTVKGVKVSLNGEEIKIKDFAAYCEMYAKAIAKDRTDEVGAESACKVFVDKDKGHPKWEVGFAVSDGSFQQVSFVNSIATTSGGTHVAFIADQMCQSLLKTLTKRVKGHNLKPQNIKNHIFIFINCLITNPAFNSQTKEQMTTKSVSFGSKCVLGDDFLKKIANSDALNDLISFAEKKADKMLAKSDGSKRSRINNAKLTEANLAGTKHGEDCTLILTEGDSAKGLAVAGRAILDPDRIGVFPLKGKILNVRDASIDQISKNAEIQSIKQILGLKHKTEYKSAKELRYGHLMIMADQDHDGSHIKGLLINFLQVQFPSLLKINDFFREFITPIVKVWQGPDPKNPTREQWFFTQPEYETWKQAHANQKWDLKYYKGLGTSSSEDAQRYFSNLDEHLKEFDVMQPNEAELFELAFSKKRADDRKEWIGNFVPGTFLDHTTKAITYGDFVNKELILFSIADNMRSIPSMIDGLKPGQRKVMYACFLRGLNKDMKVNELAGFVSQKTAYHHGEVALQQTIIGLAQDFVGSNNVNCLEPSGNFGSRLSGGGDAASPRYIFTRLSPFARKVFVPLDEPCLTWQHEEGKKIEPMAYAPVVPMVLINGADGIGTGWSTSIPNYHPEDVVRNLRRRMGRFDPEDPEERPFETMTPWFRGWNGTPEPVQGQADRYRFNGIARRNPDNPLEVTISELPIRMWTDDFKGRLEEIMSGVKRPSWIKDYKEFNDHRTVHFEIVLDEKNVKPDPDEDLIEKFKLAKQVATSNLVAFDSRGRIRKFSRVEEILEEFYLYRYDMYTKRKAHWLAVHHSNYRKLQNQARFVREIIEGELIVGKKRKDVLVSELRERKYEPFPPPTGNSKAAKDDDDGGGEDENAQGELSGGALDYNYLLSMPIWSLTAERLERLNELILRKKVEHDELEALSEKDLWCKDLDDFVDVWTKELEEQAQIAKKIHKMGRRRSKKIGAGGAGTSNGSRRTKKGDDDYSPVKSKASKPGPKPKALPKIEMKTHERFAEKFGGAGLTKTAAKTVAAVKPKKEVLDDDDADDADFGTLTKAKPEEAPELEPKPVASSRTKRAAASKPKSWVVSDDSETNDDSLIGDVAALVKGIGSTADGPGTGRVSLLAMSRPESGGGEKDKPVSNKQAAKAKPSKTFDFDDSLEEDDTNLDILEKPSPRKPATAAAKPDVTDPDSSDDAVTAAEVAKPNPVAKAVAAVAKPAADSTKKRGRSPGAAAKKTATEAPKKVGRPPGSVSKKPSLGDKNSVAKPAAKPLGQSPAARAYVAQKAKAKARTVISDDEDEDEDELYDDPVPPPPRAAAARGRPSRAAAVAKPKPVYDELDDSMTDELEEDDDDGSDDPFEMGDD